jgi:hypothetical protein
MRRADPEITKMILERLPFTTAYLKKVKAKLMDPELISIVFASNNKKITDLFMSKLSKFNLDDESDEDDDFEPEEKVSLYVLYLQQAISDNASPELISHWLKGMCDFQRRNDCIYVGINEVVNLLCEHGQVELVKAALPLAPEFLSDPYVTITCALNDHNERVMQLLNVIWTAHHSPQEGGFNHFASAIAAVHENDLTYLIGLYNNHEDHVPVGLLRDALETEIEKRKFAVNQPAVVIRPLADASLELPPSYNDAILESKAISARAPLGFFGAAFKPASSDAIYANCMKTLQDTLATLSTLVEQDPGLAKKIWKEVKEMKGGELMKAPKKKMESPVNK